MNLNDLLDIVITNVSVDVYMYATDTAKLAFTIGDVFRASYFLNDNILGLNVEKTEVSERDNNGLPIKIKVLLENDSKSTS